MRPSNIIDKMGSSITKQPVDSVKVKFQPLEDHEWNTGWIMEQMRRYHDAVRTKKIDIQQDVETLFDAAGMSLLLNMYHLDNSMVTDHARPDNRKIVISG